MYLHWNWIITNSVTTYRILSKLVILVYKLILSFVRWEITTKKRMMKMLFRFNFAALNIKNLTILTYHSFVPLLDLKNTQTLLLFSIEINKIPGHHQTARRIFLFYSKFHGLRSLLVSQLFWVNFDHFWSELHYLRQLGQLTICKFSMTKSAKQSVGVCLED